jgi:hypothetical protein
MKRKKLLLLTRMIFIFFLVVSSSPVASQEKKLNWHRLAELKPDLKVLILVEGERPVSIKDLAVLAELGMVPADRDPALVVGLRRAIFSTKLRKWMVKPSLPSHLNGKLLERFVMSGIYRLGFRIEEEGYAGPLSLEITAPRNSYGKRLLFSENLIRPQASSSIRTDVAENRWFYADYPEVRYGQTIKIFFTFKYLVDMASLVDHDLMVVEQFENASIPEEVRSFLAAGYKIDSHLPQAMDWAKQGGSGPPDARSEYRRLAKFLKETVTYDKVKREQYFGGKLIYSDLDEMYQEIEMTLTRRVGACPDTTLLECAFLRARGIPCRTAGRVGHFFSLVFVPGKGWMSTSVTPTGIPLFIAPGPDHVPYQRWSPPISMRTVLVEAKSRIETVEE